LINKTFKQLNAERAARRAGFKVIHQDLRFLDKKKKKINKSSSSQAGGPAHKESGFKRLKKVAKIYEDQKILEEHFKKV